jgi:hypothetical protein
VVLIGSKYSDPWVALFEPHMHFVFRTDARQRISSVINRSPHPGEMPRYAYTQADDSHSVNGVVALDRTSEHPGRPSSWEGSHARCGVIAQLEVRSREDGETLVEIVELLSVVDAISAMNACHSLSIGGPRRSQHEERYREASVLEVGAAEMGVTSVRLRRLASRPAVSVGTVTGS